MVIKAEKTQYRIPILRQIVILMLLSMLFSKDCWKSDAHERPLFPHILQSLEKIGSSDFAATAADSFRSMQESWKAEIERIFADLKEREKVHVTV